MKDLLLFFLSFFGAKPCFFSVRTRALRGAKRRAAHDTIYEMHQPWRAASLQLSRMFVGRCYTGVLRRSLRTLTKGIKKRHKPIEQRDKTFHSLRFQNNIQSSFHISVMSYHIL